MKPLTHEECSSTDRNDSCPMHEYAGPHQHGDIIRDDSSNIFCWLKYGFWRAIPSNQNSALGDFEQDDLAEPLTLLVRGGQPVACSGVTGLYEAALAHHQRIHEEREAAERLTVVTAVLAAARLRPEPGCTLPLDALEAIAAIVSGVSV